MRPLKLSSTIIPTPISGDRMWQTRTKEESSTLPRECNMSLASVGFSTPRSLRTLSWVQPTECHVLTRISELLLKVQNLQTTSGLLWNSLWRLPMNTGEQRDNIHQI